MKYSLSSFLLTFSVLLLVSCNRKEMKDSVEESFHVFIYPIDNIKIDGDLGDWPEYITSYSLQCSSNKDSSDYAYFQMGYLKEENSLVVGVTYHDESLIVDKQMDWLTQDSYSFYIDEKHDVNGSGINRYTFNEIMMDNSDPTISWDTSTKDYFNWDKIEKKIKTEGNVVYVEFKYRLSESVNIGSSIGIDHVIVDVDTVGVSPSYYRWVGNPYSDRTSGKIGTLMLIDEEISLDEVRGQISIKEDDVEYPAYLKLISEHEDAFWMKVKVDEKGRFNAKVPKGKYEIAIQDNLTLVNGSYQYIDLEPSFKITGLASSIMNPFDIPMIVTPLPDLLPEEGILNDGFSSEDELVVDNFIQTYMEYYSIPGVSIAIINKGKVVYHQSYGVENFYTKAPVTNNTIFEGASMTKPMFAFAVLRLAERGLIDLDKPLYEYVSPPSDVADNIWHKLITGRIVLNHQTGFPNWADDMPDSKLKFLFKPGTDIGYSGAGFTFLRRAVEAIMEKPITEILNAEVVNNLNLEDMYFKKEPGLKNITAHGHILNNPRIKNIPEEAQMASSVHTTAKSYAEFIIALSQRKGMKPETYKSFINRTLQRSEHIENGELCKHYYSLGLSLRDSPFFGLSFGHSGSNGDFQCTSTIYEDTKNGFVVMTNSSLGRMLQYHLHNLLNIGTKQVDP